MEPVESQFDLPSGHIRNVGMVNLLSAKSASDLAHIKSISDVGVVVYPEELYSAISAIPMSDVGAIVPCPSGEDVAFMAGQWQVSGEALAAGPSNSLLFVAGQMIVTSEVASVGYRGIQVAGQLIAPKGSESALMGKIKSVMGQSLFYPTGARLMFGAGEIDRNFLEWTASPTPLAFFGGYRITEDVDSDLLRAKVPAIFLAGRLEVPHALKGVAEFLTTDKFGEIASY